MQGNNVNNLPRLEEIQKFYAKSNAKGFYQVFITLFFYLIGLIGMYASYQYSWVAALPFAIVTSYAITRLFIIQHDCNHHSIFVKRRLNIWVGRALSMLTLVPFQGWGVQHLLHHKANGNLDKRGYGDVILLTVKEYLALSSREKFLYRILRNFFLMLCVLAPLYFIVLLRFPSWLFPKAKFSAKQIKSYSREMHLTNLGLLVVYGFLFYFLGYQLMLTLYLFAFWLNTANLTLGFYAQHNFPEAYYSHEDHWKLVNAALQGSSYYKISRFFDWVIYHIGYHSVHHLYPKIPGYHLREVHHTFAIFKQTRSLTVQDLPMLAQLRLYDEDSKRIIGWKEFLARSS